MKNVLIIEDETVLRKGVVDILSFEGFSVLEAENGIIGVQKVLENLPDLILCDIMMPEMDGYEVFRLVRENESAKLIPFVFLTALAERSDVRAGMGLGSDDYISKPFTREELLEVVKTQLSKSEVFKEHADGALNELRYNIITRLPHELRTPLNGIVGYGQMLKDYPVSLSQEEIPKIGHEIYTSAMRLYRLIENYLIYVRLELTKTEDPKAGNHKQFLLENPGEICKKAANKIATNYGRVGDLILNTLNNAVNIPQTDFAKIVEELVDNAFKFSVTGSRVVVDCGSANGTFYLIVEDNGRGMTVAEIKNIEAYMQFDRDLHEQQGSGLGLIIVKRIVGLHNGLFNIESTIGKGNKVTVTFPDYVHVDSIDPKI